MAKFVILGGGIAGVSAALELADAGHEIEIIERFSELLSGSSDDTPCRLGLGFHYPDHATAIKYLHTTIEILKKYPDYIITGPDKNDLNHPYRRGRYFAVEGSQFDLEEICKLHKVLKEEYKKLVEQDPQNKVLGDPEFFSKSLPVSEYENSVNTSYIVAAFETAEQTLDWPRLKKHLIDRVNNRPNITVHRNTKVTSFESGVREEKTAHFRYQVNLKNTQDNDQKHAPILTDHVINATWENIETLNETAGFHMKLNSRTNRTKLLIEIELPPHFETTLNPITTPDGNIEWKTVPAPAHPMFFCFGPYTALTPVGGNKAYLTYEPITNVKDPNGVEQKTMGLDVSEFSARLLAGKATEEEKQWFGTSIIQGAAKFIKNLAGAKVLSVRFGNVRTLGRVDINDPESDHHKRDKDDIRSLAVGLIQYPSMKLLYFMAGSMIVKQKIVTPEEKNQSDNTKKIVSMLVNTINQKSKICRELLATPPKLCGTFQEKKPEPSLTSVKNLVGYFEKRTTKRKPATEAA